MKIVRAALYKVPLTSHATYYMADGKSCATLITTMLGLTTDCGRTGWGEVCPIPGYLPAYEAGVVPGVEALAPVLFAADPVGPEAVMAACDAVLPGHPFVKSIVDMALWDLTAQAAGLPLYRLLGGCHSRRLPLYHSITCIAPEEMARIAKTAFQKGIRQFQAKLGVDANWEADVARLRMVREAVGSGPLVYGDWNMGASRLDAIRVGRAVSDIDVMLEQPCSTLEACAAVRRATGLPMKLDESVHDLDTLLEAHRLGIAEVVAVKLSKFGGVSAARRARDLCVHLGISMVIEDVWGSDITTAAGLHLAAATPPRSVVNVCDLSGYVAPRLDPGGPVRSAAGDISPPEGPGLGVTPSDALLERPELVIAA